MAKAKNPKKSNAVNESVSAAGTPPAAPEANAMMTEAAVTAGSDSIMKKTAPRKAATKPEIVKSEPRSSVVVPINVEEEIRSLAYLFSERRGFMPGHETDDWLAAEHEVLQRYHQHGA